MKAPKIFSVLACVDLSAEAGRRKLVGVYRFLSEGTCWDLTLIRSQKEFAESFKSRVESQEYDGLLIAVPESSELRQLHREIGKPTAFIDYPDAKLKRTLEECVFIHDDDGEIVRLAVQSLLAQKMFRSYGYAASSEDRPWNQRRKDKFAQALARKGICPSVLENTDAKSLEAIAAWLLEMPRPTGILAAYDDTASRMLDACRAAGLRVPEDVAVLGIGNDELICLHASPPLSSVIPDFEEEGYRAAKELQAMMLGRHKPSQREILCGCNGIANRGSTGAEMSNAMMVQQAIAYIGQNAFRGITAADVVRQLHVSRRLADLRFREITGTSILAYITNIRLNRVRELLIKTDLHIEEIARQCGYDPGNLKNLFARHFHCSMRAFRKSESST